MAQTNVQAFSGDVEIADGLTVFKDIESSNSFITERVLFKETWPNGLNSLVGDLGTWVVTNLNQQVNPGVETTPDGYGIVAFNGGTGVTNGEFVSPAFDLSDYAIVDGTLQADDKRKTTTRVFMKFWLSTRQLDSSPEVLQVQFSPDNGTTWYTVATSQDRANVDRFTMVSADLSPYILETSTQAKIRFYLPWTVGDGDYTRIGRIWIHESDVPTNLGGMWLGAGGNIGIGTTGPGGLLDIRAVASDPSVPTVHIGDNASDFGDYGMVNLVRDPTAAGSKAHLAFIRNGNTIFSQGFYNNTNTFGFWPSFSSVANTPAMSFDGSGNVGIGTTNPVGVNGGQRIEGSSTTGFEYIATRDDSTLTDGDFIGGYLFKNPDTNATEPHYAGMTAYANDTFGRMDLRFFAGRDTYEDTPTVPHMTLDQDGKLGIGTQTLVAAGPVLQVYADGNGSHNPGGGITLMRYRASDNDMRSGSIFSMAVGNKDALVFKTSSTVNTFTSDLPHVRVIEHSTNIPAVEMIEAPSGGIN